MPETTVVFVHGFVSDSNCWTPFFNVLEKDKDLLLAGFTFQRFEYPTEFIEWDPRKRIPTIKECGNRLWSHLETCAPKGKVMLVGHSMGGLVIQSLLAEKIGAGRGSDLARIRSVILFATPNRGSTMLKSLRGIFDFFRKDPQDEQLSVLDEAVAEVSDTIVKAILGAKCVDRDCCPIPFRVFWGDQDNVVPEASARGPFIEASALPGDHSEILKCNPKDAKDQRFLCLKDALLNPVGHPSIYEFDLFEVSLTIAPMPSDKPILLAELDKPITVYADNFAIRSIRIDVSKQNRCRTPYPQTYISENGYVQSLGFTEPNEILPEDHSENRRTGQKFKYVFKPDRDQTFALHLKIYKGFGDGQRNWHNHMNQSANYKLFRLTLNLTAYHDAGYRIAPEPQLYFFDQNIDDHTLCKLRELKSPLPALPQATDPWVRTWEMADIRCGVVDLNWDVVKPA